MIYTTTIKNYTIKKIRKEISTQSIEIFKKLTKNFLGLKLV